MPFLLCSAAHSTYRAHGLALGQHEACTRHAKDHVQCFGASQLALLPGFLPAFLIQERERQEYQQQPAGDQGPLVADPALVPAIGNQSRRLPFPCSEWDPSLCRLAGAPPRPQSQRPAEPRNSDRTQAWFASGPGLNKPHVHVKFGARSQHRSTAWGGSNSMPWNGTLGARIEPNTVRQYT